MLEHLVNPHVKQIQISGIRKIANLVSTMPDAVALTIGQPDFPTPAHIIEAGKRALDENKTVYTPNAGLIELRRAAASFMQSKYGLSYDPEEEVIVTTGASEALDISLRTILEPGSEVVLPAPVYPGYEPIIRMCGAVPVYVDTTKSGFKLTPELLKSALTDKTRAVILGYPSNPTGRSLGRDELKQIAALLKDRDLFVVSDEIYSELVYDEPHGSIAAFPEMKAKTIVVNGLSKSHAMTGWRIGFAFAPAYLARHLVKVHQYNVTCASSISQYAAIEALTNGRDDAEPMRREYKMRRDYVCDRLAEIGFDVVKPEGAFYVFPSIRKFGMTSIDFTMRLLERERVAVVPGDAFTPYGEGHVRISYAYSMERLKLALDRIERFVRSL